MTANRFDQAARYQAKLDGPGLLAWLLELPPADFQFIDWLDARTIPFPGEPDRVCDTVAQLELMVVPGRRWAVPVEFQLKPDREMFGRFLEYLGRLWRELRPNGGGRRFRVGAAVVNLRGRKRTLSRRQRLGNTLILTRLRGVERHLAKEGAATTLNAIAAGSVAKNILPWIPLMHGGGEDAIIQQWLAVAGAEPNRRLRGDYGGLAVIYSELTAARAKWDKALKGWNMIESTHVKEWIAQGEAVGEVRGEVRGRLETLRQTLRDLLEDQFGTLPPSLLQQIDAIDDIAALRQAVRQAPHLAKLDDLQL